MPPEILPETAPRQTDAALIAAFATRHFSLRGSLALHRHALGLDLIRAPINIAMAPVALLARLAVPLLRRRFPRAARWLDGRSFHWRTAVDRALSQAAEVELLAPRGSLTPEARAQLAAWTGTRGAVSEIVTTTALIAGGALAYGSLTPGAFTLAPLIADQAAHARAIAGFPLGKTLGGLWYGWFPAHVSLTDFAASLAALLVAMAVLGNFAGILADPVQRALGIHRRRLARLLARIDAAEAAPGVAPEHMLARAGDLADLVASVLRLFRS